MESFQIDNYYNQLLNNYLDEESKFATPHWKFKKYVIYYGEERDFLLEQLQLLGVKNFAAQIGYDVQDLVNDLLAEPVDQDDYESMMEDMGAERVED